MKFDEGVAGMEGDTSLNQLRLICLAFENVGKKSSTSEHMAEIFLRHFARTLAGTGL